MEEKKQNVWKILTIVFGVLLLISWTNLFGASQTEAKANVQAYLDALPLEATAGEVTKEGDLYKLDIDVEGQIVEAYVSKDGKTLFTSPIDLIDIPDLTGSTTQEPKEVPKSDKPIVDLFVMTHCPYGTQAEKGFIPAIKVLGDKIDANIKFVHYFLHEPEETETPIQICLREEQSDKFLDYLECFLEDGDSARCITEVGIDESALNSCIEEKYEAYYAEDSKDSEAAGVRGSPTIIINGQLAEGGRSADAYLKTICLAFNTAPEECTQELDSVTPSPGFGYTAGTTSTGSC